MKKREIIISLLSGALLCLALIASSRFWFRIDLTKNKAYTISTVSKNLYTEIDEPVRLTYYLSERLSRVHPAPGEIEDLLREYAAFSHGAIEVEVKDPAKANLTRAAEELGILPQQIRTVEQDQASVATVYSGIVIEYLDQYSVIPFVISLQTLEYDLTSRIRSLVRGQAREAGVLPVDTGKTWEEDYRYLAQYLEQGGYKLRLLEAGEEVPQTLPMLIVLGGAETLDNYALYRIDRYIQGGGRVFFAAESVTVDYKSNLQAKVCADQGLLAMLSSYGAELKPELVLDETNHTLPVQQSSMIQFVSYPLWIAVENANPDHPVSALFQGIDLFWANPIRLSPPYGVEGTALFSSTANSWRQTKDFFTGVGQFGQYSLEAEETRGKSVLAAALSGNIPSFFQGVDKPERPGSEPLPDMPAQPKPGRVLVAGDSDFLTNLIEMAGAARNLDFMFQALDWLGNDDDIIGIRNRVSPTGRLDRITAKPAKSRAMRAAQVVNVALIPIGLLVFGFFRIYLRKRRR